MFQWNLICIQCWLDFQTVNKKLLLWHSAKISYSQTIWGQLANPEKL